MLLQIRYLGDPVLRQRCVPVTEITEEIRTLVQDMVETMDKNNGIGLAAPQIGHPIRLFVLRNYVESEEGKWTLSDEPRVYINPKILEHTEELVSDVEGCLSLPGLRLPVERPLGIKIEAMDLNGAHFTEEIQGYNARVRMHENDHINGVLFIDRVDPSTRHEIEPLLREMKQKYSSLHK